MHKEMIKTLFIGALHETFFIALCSYIVYFAADLIKPGFVTNYINMNWFLLVLILLGMATVFADGRGAEHST